MAINNDTRKQILNFLKNCDFSGLVNTYFAENFLWIIKGTSVLSGTYTDKDIFLTQVIGRLSSKLQSGWKMHILDTYVDNNAFIIEMRGEVKTKNGQDYNNDYCWIFKFDANNKIIKLTAYYDSLLVNKTLSDEK